MVSWRGCLLSLLSLLIKVERLSDVCKTPVLLSLLVMCMRANEGAEDVNLPGEIFTLYKQAMAAVLKKALARLPLAGHTEHGSISGADEFRSLLLEVAVANHRAGKRDFDHDVLDEVLEKERVSAKRVIQKNIWNALLKEGDAPLIKILSLGDAKGENVSTPA